MVSNGTCNALLDFLLDHDSDIGAIDAKLTPPLRQHLAECEQCGALTRATTVARSDATTTAADATLAQGVVQTWRAGRRQRRTWQITLGGLFAASATFAGVVLFVSKPAPLTPVATALAPPAVRVIAGAVANDHGQSLHEIKAGELLIAGTEGATLELSNVTVVLAGATRATLESTEPGGLSARVHEGTLGAARPMPAGARINTAQGGFVVAGATFTLAVTMTQSTLTVLSGQVQVVTPNGETRFASAGTTITLPEHTSTTDVSDEPSPARHNAAKPRGQKHVGKKRTATSEAAKPASASAPATTEEFMAAALVCQQAGNWPCVAKSYESLIAKAPRSQEAMTAEAALAEVLLEHLDNAAAAIGHWDNYLKYRPQGALAREAWLGKAKAARTLNKPDAEAQALQFLIQNYPDSAYAKAASKRLKELQAK